MARLLRQSYETQEERAKRLRAETAKRLKVLLSVAVLAIGARVMIKDPPKRPPPDLSKARIKIIPGMLEALPASERARLDPQILAQMVAADEAARRGVTSLAAAPKPSGPYQPAVPPSLIDREEEAFRQKMYAYERRQLIDQKKRELEETYIDRTKNTVVQFTRGGYIKAEDAAATDYAVNIRVDKTMQAALPSRMVKSIRRDAAAWEEPVPEGRVRLRPAPGITVILDRGAARRVTMDKPVADEI